MSLRQDLLDEIKAGRAVGGGTIPINLSRVNDYIEIGKHTMVLIGGEPTAGKTTIAQTTFMIDPIEWYLKHKPEGMRLTVISFLMERRMAAYTSRWISRKIFEEQGIDIHPKRILGKKEGERLSDQEYALVEKYSTVLDDWEKDDLLVPFQGTHNPSGISMYIEAFARRHGTIIDKEKGDTKKHIKDMTEEEVNNILTKRQYIPNHPNHIVLIIGDNASVLDGEKDLNQKGLVDKFNKTMAEARDVYGFSPIIVQHLNRSISDTTRKKLVGDLIPKLSDFSDSSQTQKSADIVLALFNPFSHCIPEDNPIHNGYHLNKLRDAKFRTYYRSLHLLKNNFDAENVQWPIAMHPTYGILKTLPRVTIEQPVQEELYTEVTTGNWFLPTGEQEDHRKVAFSGFGANKTHKR